MLNKLIKLFFHKEIILYNRHRQTIPIVANPENRSAYYFFEIQYLWKMIPFSGKNKWKFRIMYQVLNLISPKYILDINWIGKWHSLYYLWCKRHPESKFVVVQHGSYVGGIVTDIPHRYTKCQVFLCWGNYFTNLFRAYNQGKRVTCFSFGNTVYNQSNRDQYAYGTTSGHRVLMVPSAIGGERLQRLTDFKDHLVTLGFSVDIKEHNYQSKLFEEIKGFNKITGDIYDILRKKTYDLVISDHSSCLLDAIYFKNKTLFFSPGGEVTEYSHNRYNDFMMNIALDFEKTTSPEAVFELVDIVAQEELFRFFISDGDNDLNNLS